MNYRPYKSTDELIKDFIERRNIFFNTDDKILSSFFRTDFLLPIIWIKNKKYKNRVFISGFNESDGEQYVIIEGEPYKLESLFEDFTYIDGSPCGRKI